MDRMTAVNMDQSNLEWIDSYAFAMDPSAPNTDVTGFAPGPQSAWQQPLGPNPYDFAFDEAAAQQSRKFSAASNALSHSSTTGVSPSPSLFPSVSSVQSSPNTSPTSADPAVRYMHGPVRDSRRSTVSAGKRPRDDFEQAAAAPRNVKLDEENRYLVYLRDQQRLPWKEISRKFEQTFQRPFQAPALQMRYGRLKNRLHPWTEADNHALQMAQEYYVNKRFEIIAEKMLEFGATDAWAPRVCARKLRQLEKEGNAPASPTMSHSSEEQSGYSGQMSDATLRSTSPHLPGGGGAHWTA